jgi:hypothetical protein
MAAEKGTPEYDDIMMKLKTETYKHQNDIGEETAKKLAEGNQDGSDASIPSERNFNMKQEGEALNMSLKMDKVVSV